MYLFVSIKVMIQNHWVRAWRVPIRRKDLMSPRLSERAERVLTYLGEGWTVPPPGRGLDDLSHPVKESSTSPQHGKGFKLCIVQHNKPNHNKQSISPGLKHVNTWADRFFGTLYFPHHPVIWIRNFFFPLAFQLLPRVGGGGGKHSGLLFAKGQGKFTLEVFAW